MDVHGFTRRSIYSSSSLLGSTAVVIPNLASTWVNAISNSDPNTSYQSHSNYHTGLGDMHTISVVTSEYLPRKRGEETSGNLNKILAPILLRLFIAGNSLQKALGSYGNEDFSMVSYYEGNGLFESKRQRIFFPLIEGFSFSNQIEEEPTYDFRYVV